MGPWAQRSIGAWWPSGWWDPRGGTKTGISPSRSTHLPATSPPPWGDVPSPAFSSFPSCLVASPPHLFSVLLPRAALYLVPATLLPLAFALGCCSAAPVVSSPPAAPLSLHVPLAPRLSPPLLQALLFGSFFPPGCRSPCRSSEQFLFPIRMTVSLQSLQPPWAPDERPWLAFLPTTHSSCLGCLLPLPSCAAPPSADSSWCAPSSTCLCAPAVL